MKISPPVRSVAAYGFLFLLSVALAGSAAAQSPAAEIDISPSSLDFGVAYAGDREETENVVVRNSSGVPVRILEVFIEGGRGNFDIQEAGTRADCEGVLAPGETIECEVEFDPSTPMRPDEVDDFVVVFEAAGGGSGIPPRISNFRYDLIALEDESCPTDADYDVYSLAFDYTDENGDVGEGSSIDYEWLYLPSENSGSGTTDSFDQSGTGFGGTISTLWCIAFGSDTSIRWEFTLIDNGEEVSNTLNQTIFRPEVSEMAASPVPSSPPLLLQGEGTTMEQAFRLTSGGASLEERIPVRAEVRALEFDPEALDFDDTVVGESATETVRITNRSHRRVEVEALAVDPSGGVDAHWTVEPSAFSLNAGSTQTVRVTYSPTSVENVADGRLVADYEFDGEVEAGESIPLTASSLLSGPLGEVSPLSHDFGSVSLSDPSPSVTVTFTNRSAFPVYVCEAATGSEAFEVDPTGAGPVSASGGVGTFEVTFAPAAPGVYEDALELTVRPACDDEMSESLFTVDLRGEATPRRQPDIDVSPLSLSFDETGQGLEVVVRNVGTAPLNLAGAAVTGADADAFSARGDAAGALTLAPVGGAPNSATLEVVFAAAEPGSYTASLVLASDDPDEPRILVDLSAALLAPPEITCSASELDFGSVTVGETASRAFTCTNTGPVALRVDRASTTGGDFRIVEESSGPLAPSSRFGFRVLFEPRTGGTRSGTFVLPWGNDQVSDETVIRLTGTGLAPCIELSDEELSFAAQTGETSTETIEVRNDCDAPLRVASVTLDDPTAPFSVTPTTLDVEPGESRSLAVTYAPIVSGQHEVILTIVSNAPDRPEVEVAMTGTSRGLLVEAPSAPLGFGDVRLGVTSVEEVTFTNLTSAPYPVEQIRLEGDGFSIPVNRLDLAPAGEDGSSRTIPVTFGPEARNAYEAVLRFRTLEVDVEGEVLLQGRGVAPLAVLTAADPLAVGAAVAGDRATTFFLLGNEGNAPLAVSGLRVDGPAGDRFAAFMPEATGTCEADAAPGAVRDVPEGERHVVCVHYAPLPGDTGSASATLVLTTDDPGGDRTVALEAQAVTITNNTPSSVPSGSGAEVVLELSGDLSDDAYDGVTLHYRRGGDPWSVDRTVAIRPGPTDANFTFAIPPSAIGERGVQYYIAFEQDGERKLTLPVDDPEEQPYQLRVALTDVEAPLAIRAETCRMLTLPLDVGQVALEEILEEYGALDPDNWRALRWEPGTGRYVSYAAPRPGEAFWLVTAFDTPFAVERATSTDLGAPVRVILPPGWSQIASPYPFDVAWADVLAWSGLDANAVSPPYGWDATACEGDLWQPDRTRLAAWNGYFVENRTGTEQVLTFRPVEAPPAAPGLTLRPFPEAGYTLQVTASVDGTSLRDAGNYLALTRTGADARDLAEPPARRGALDLSVAENGERYIGRMKAVSDGQQWDLVLHLDPSERARDIRLALHEHGARPGNFEIAVVDVDAGHLLPVENGTVEVPMGATSERRLRVTVGTPGYLETKTGDAAPAPREFALHGNYPNPFNPETMIRYTLRTGSQVTLSIHNVLGQQVRSLVSADQPAGTHSVRWDARDDAGRETPSGVYFYTIRAGDFTATRRMLLLR